MSEDDPAGPGVAAADRAPASRSGDIVRDFGLFAPWAVIAYCLALAALRISLSPFLEIDEAEFVGNVDFRLLYDNAHPPLYNWATRIALVLTDWSWAQAMAMVKYSLLALYHYLIWNCATRLAGPRAGAMALAASAFLPQVLWMSAATLSHSVMILAGAAATLHAVLRVLEAPHWRSYAWLGVAITLGALAKFNFALLLAPLLLAFASHPKGRALFTAPGAWAAPATLLLLCGPTYIAALLFPESSGARLGKLYRESDFAALDLPGVGVDGGIELARALGAWAGAALAVWAGARLYDHHRGGGGAARRSVPIGAARLTAADVGEILGRAMLIGLALLALLVLAADISAVEERYLTPLLAVTPVYLALRWPLGRSAPAVLMAALTLYASVFAGLWAMTTFDAHRFKLPYAAIAAQIRVAEFAPAPIIAQRHVDRANLVLALGWPGARAPRYQALQDDAILLWPGRGAPPERLVPPGFGPASPITTVAAPYANRSGAEAVYRFQRFVRTVRPPTG
ncbi:MAG: glycosyltransferase family 39 protein [Pseudomonadota bacterium]